MTDTVWPPRLHSNYFVLQQLLGRSLGYRKAGGPGRAWNHGCLSIRLLDSACNEYTLHLDLPFGLTQLEVRSLKDDQMPSLSHGGAIAALSTALHRCSSNVHGSPGSRAVYHMKMQRDTYSRRSARASGVTAMSSSYLLLMTGLSCGASRLAHASGRSSGVCVPLSPFPSASRTGQITTAMLACAESGCFHSRHDFTSLCGTCGSLYPRAFSP